MALCPYPVSAIERCPWKLKAIFSQGLKYNAGRQELSAHLCRWVPSLMRKWVNVAVENFDLF